MIQSCKKVGCGDAHERSEEILEGDPPSLVESIPLLYADLDILFVYDGEKHP
jgi:hypothetical protein